MSDKIKIDIFSISCCYPAHADCDGQYVNRLKEALNRTGVEAQINLVTATDAFLGMRVGIVQKMMPLLNKYGAAAAPALFINGELVLYGGVPSVEKLTEVIQQAAAPSEGTEKNQI